MSLKQISSVWETFGKKYNQDDGMYHDSTNLRYAERKLFVFGCEYNLNVSEKHKNKIYNTLH